MSQKFIFSLTILLMLGICQLTASTEIIAHRGGASLAPENTLAAFSKAIEVGADYFELDVRVSLDDSLVIIHDDTIDRTTNGSGNVSSMYYIHLRYFDAGSWFGEEFAGEKIPTLAEALELALASPNEIGVVIEIKAITPTIVQKVIDEVQKRNMQDRVIISSFIFEQIEQSKKIDSSIPVQLFATIIQENINQVSNIGGEWVGTGGIVTQALLDSTHIKGMFMNKWTVNSADEMLHLIDLGVDAITTDYPQTAIAVMDSTPPSDVVMMEAKVNITKVKLSWDAAIDMEGGISGYEIYRDTTASATTLLTTVADTTSYIDETQQEETTFYYRLKAKNVAGLTSLNYSNELSATTEIDSRPPKIVAISSFGEADKIVVKFSEWVDKATAETIENYQINNDVTINSVTLTLDSLSVILNTSALAEGTEYTLSITGIADLATIPNLIVEPEVVVFMHTNFLSQTIAAWDFDQSEGQTLTDVTGNSNDGTIMNGVSWSGGYVANGLTFDGVDDYVEINSTGLAASGDAVSISVWVNLAYLPAELPTAYGPIFDSETDNYVLYEDRGNNELRFKVTTNNSAERPGIPAADLVINEWIHIIGVYDGTKAMVYLNGELKDTHNLTGNVSAGQAVTVGRTGTSYFEGSMDNIYVFDRALNEDEVAFLYVDARTAIIDEEPPQVLNVTSFGSDPKVYVQFNEKVDIFSAGTISNYTIDNGVTITNAKICVGNETVILSTSLLSDDVAYTLTVSNIEDQAEEPNIIDPGTMISFSYKIFPEGLVSYWSLDEGIDTTAYDGTANNNSGILKNGTQWAPAKFGNGLSFDGVDDYVLIPSSPSLNIDTNTVTLSLWVKLDYLPADMPGPYGPLYDSDSDNYVIYGDRGNNELRFKVTTASWWAERPGIPGSDLVVDEWLHIVGVYDGSHASIYLNGKLKDSHTLSGNIMANSGDIFLGRTGTTYFNGEIDNVQVYGRGLTEQEVAYLYSGSSVPSLSVNKVEEMTVSLSWQHQADPVQGISGYKIYRDTTVTASILIATVGDTAEYIDFTAQEFTNFYYRIKSVDAAGIESDYFSNEVMTTTGADVTPPEIVNVMTTGEANKVLIHFSEPVDSTLAENIANYAIDNSVVINSAKISAGNSNVMIDATGLVADVDFTITVNNITDMAQTPNTIVSNTQKTFKFYPYFDNLISYWPLDEGTDTVAVDITGNGNNAAIFNSPAWVDGVFGNALRFDGMDDYVEIPNSPLLNIDTNEVTLLFWVKLDYLPTEMPTSIG
ncbi:hypothetical protein KJ762_03155, partial [bacterium]|nr:hypothetical protein [bacterium]